MSYEVVRGLREYLLLGEIVISFHVVPKNGPKMGGKCMSTMKEGGSLQTLDLGFSSASVYGGDTVTAVELELYELFV